jgi:ribosome biogenesis GTPase
VTLTKKTSRKRIKPNRKPKLARERNWRERYLSGELDQEELDSRQVERIVPRSREEKLIEIRTKVEQELTQQAPPDIDQQETPKDGQTGTVIQISTSIYHVDLGDTVLLCAVRGSLTASETGYTNIVAVGDKVLVSPGDAGHGVIEHVLPRRTVLARPDVWNEDLSQIVVANVDQLLIVSSWEEPPLWLELIDRYLIAASEGGLESLICLNKIDLAESEQDYEPEMSIYEDLGYQVLYTSVETGQGIDELRQHLEQRSTVLAGLSGTGKSSLLMAVQPDLQLRIAQVSHDTGAGRHTTTQVSLLKLDEGGYVVDTPGIRELGLISTRRHELILHFPEIAEMVSQCRFNDCTHLHEPGCAVKEAVEDGRIPWSRYASYQSIYESLPEYYT